MNELVQLKADGFRIVVPNTKLRNGLVLKFRQCTFPGAFFLTQG